MSPRSPKVNKPSRKSRLRLSCHDCFKAKVKCNKARPGCARCLTIGRECGYVEYDKDGNVVGNTDCEPEAGGPLYAVRNDNSFNTFPGHGQDWDPALTATEENMGPVMPGPGILGGGLGLGGSIGASISTPGQAETGLLTDPPSAPMAWPPLNPSELLNKQSPISIHEQQIFYQKPSYEAPPLVPFPETPYRTLIQQDPAQMMVDQAGSPMNPWTPSQYCANSNTPSLSMPFRQYPSQLGPNAELDTPNPAHWPVHHQACECVGYCLGELKRLEAVSEGGGTDMLDLDDILTLGTSALDECSALLMCETCTQTPGRQASEMLAGATLIRISYLYLDGTCRILQTQNGHERAAQRTRLAQGLARFDGVCGAYAQMFGGLGYGSGGGVVTPMMEHLGEKLKVLRAVCDWRAGAV